MKHPSRKFALPAILLLGLAIRLLALRHALSPGVSAPTMDEMNYRELACEILDHHRYATWSEGFLTRSTRAPIYPLSIAAAYLISGNRGYAVPKILNLIFDMLAILAVHALALRLYDSKTALTSATVYAVFGHAVNYMLISSPHTLAVLLTLLAANALAGLNDNYKHSAPLLALLQALLIHTRPVFLVALPFMIPAIYLQLTDFAQSTPKKAEGRKNTVKLPSLLENIIRPLKTDFKTKCLKTAFPLALTLLLCIPWGLRNYQVHKIAVPVCTIAGWHIASDGRFDKKLSLKFLMDNIYAPEHRGFSEADYFLLARRMFFDALLRHPVRIPLFGLARLVAGWSPPSPWWRFAAPKAYVFPIRIGDSAILPLPDFEGMLYIFVFANLAVVVFRKRLGGKAWETLANAFREFRGISVWMAGYSAAHVIGIPLIAYRFIIEPLFIVFATAFLINCWRAFRGPRVSDASPGEGMESETVDESFATGGIAAFPTVFAASFIIFLALPAFSTVSDETINYPRIIPSPGTLSYNQIREAQWAERGNVPQNARLSVAGVVEYGARGFKFTPDEYNPVKSPASASARLRVGYASPKHPAGIGDLRLNFEKSKLPPDGSAVSLQGTVQTGPFKELILNVEKISEIKPRHRHPPSSMRKSCKTR